VLATRDPVNAEDARGVTGTKAITSWVTERVEKTGYLHTHTHTNTRHKRTRGK
jgi:hypothetical protein